MEKFFLNVCRLCSLKLLGLLLLFSSRTAIVYGDIETKRIEACIAIVNLTYRAMILETAGQTLDMNYLWVYRSLLQRIYFGHTSDTPPYPEEAYECFKDISQRFRDSKTTAQPVMKLPSFKKDLGQYRRDVETLEDSLLFSRYFETLYALVLDNFAEMLPGNPEIKKAREEFLRIGSKDERSEEIKTNKKILLEEALLVRVKNFDESDWKELAAMVSHVELPSDSRGFSHEFLQNIEIYRTQYSEVVIPNDIDLCHAVSYFITQYHPTLEYPKIEANLRQQQEKNRILDSIRWGRNRKDADGEIIDWHKLVEQTEKTINTTIIEVIAQKWLILEYTKQTDTKLTLPEQDIRLLASTLYQVLHEKKDIPAEYFQPVSSEEFFNFLANLCEEKLKLKKSAPASPQSSEASKNTPLEERYMSQLYAMILTYYQEKIEGTPEAFGDIPGRLDRLNGKFANRDSSKQSLLESALSCNVQALTECELDELTTFATNYSLEENRTFSSPDHFSDIFATRFAANYRKQSKILPKESEKIGQILGVFFTSYHTGMKHTKLVALQELQEANDLTEKEYDADQKEYIEQAKKEKKEAEALSKISKQVDEFHMAVLNYAKKAERMIMETYQFLELMEKPK